MELLTPDDAAKFLKLSASTLGKLRLSGGGPAYVKFARHVRYRSDELSRWVLSRERTSTSESSLVN
jgi:molybdenum cofactor biosynthesis enzyme MoaA